MENQFVTYEIALALKELGFDEKCLAVYHIASDEEKFGVYEVPYFLTTEKDYFNSGCETIKTPLWQQAIDWLITKGYMVYVEHSAGIWSGIVEDSKGFFEFPFDEDELNLSKLECNHKAREQAILKAIELIKAE